MIKIFLIVSILSSGVTYSTQYESMKECLNAKEEVLNITPQGVEAYCISQSDKQRSEFDKDMDEATERLTRTILSTFQAILTKVMIDIQREGLQGD